MAVAVLSGLAWALGLTNRTTQEVMAPKPPPPLVADFRGVVEYRPAGRAWRALRWSDVFSQGDQLRTGEDGSCDILLTWGTGFRLQAFTALNAGRREALDRGFRRSKVDVIDIETGRPYVKPLMRFFKERGRRNR